jgi:PST family polysaccharide transporter
LLVGRFLGPAALGIYTLAFRVPEFFIKQFSGIIGRVIFPAFIKVRDDNKMVDVGFLLTMRYVNMVTIPLGVGLTLLAEPFVLAVFSDKWVDCIPVLRAIALYAMLRAMVFNIGSIFKAIGYIGILVKINIWQILISLPAIWWAAKYGSIEAVAWIQVLLAIIFGGVQLIATVFVLQISIRQIVETMHLTLYGVAIMAIAMIGTLRMSENMMPIVQLAASVTIGGLVYLSSLWWLQYNEIVTAAHTLRMVLFRRQIAH